MHFLNFNGNGVCHKKQKQKQRFLFNLLDIFGTFYEILGSLKETSSGV